MTLHSPLGLGDYTLNHYVEYEGPFSRPPMVSTKPCGLEAFSAN